MWQPKAQGRLPCFPSSPLLSSSGTAPARQRKEPLKGHRGAWVRPRAPLEGESTCGFIWIPHISTPRPDPLV